MHYIKKTLKILAWIIGVILAVVVLFFIYFNLPVANKNEQAQLGVTFSSRYASDIGMDWRKAYLATLDDLGAKKIRIPVYWDLVEKTEGKYDFSDIDWELAQARKRNVQIVLVVGQKVPRWPECAIPDWARVSDQKRKDSLRAFEKVVIERYKNEPEIEYWQVENEPFLVFGVCPKPDPSLLDSEIALVHKLDPSRKIIVTDSGELSLWIQAAKRADIFGTTMYRNVYKAGVGYYTYPIGPRFFRFKYGLINLFAHQENAVVMELQAEPWIAGYTTNQPLSEQFKSMTAEKLKANVDYAQKVGFPQIYLWGVEWWYWLKTEKNYPAVWDTAKELFSENKQNMLQ